MFYSQFVSDCQYSHISATVKHPDECLDVRLLLFCQPEAEVTCVGAAAGDEADDQWEAIELHNLFKEEILPLENYL